MVRVTKGEIFEVAIWLAFAAFAYAFSLQFDRGIEIYKFGATGWPRTIILLIALGAIGQLYDDVRSRRAAGPGAAADSKSPSEVDPGYVVRVAAILITPFVFAFLLEGVGFYTLTPFFVAVFLYIGGERRWSRIVGISLLIYVLMVFFFAKLLFVGLPVGNWHPFYDYSNWLLVHIQ